MEGFQRFKNPLRAFLFQNVVKNFSFVQVVFVFLWYVSCVCYFCWFWISCHCFCFLQFVCFCSGMPDACWVFVNRRVFNFVWSFCVFYVVYDHRILFSNIFRMFIFHINQFFGFSEFYNLFLELLFFPEFSFLRFWLVSMFWSFLFF